MTRNVALPAGAIEEVKAAPLTTLRMVELTLTIAGYKTMNLFLVALDTAEANDEAPV